MPEQPITAASAARLPLTAARPPAACPPATEPRTTSGKPAAADPAASTRRARGPAARRSRRYRRALAMAVPVLLVGAIFGFALPRLASYGAVWHSVTAMRWPGITLIALTFAVSQAATWAMIAAVLPSVRLRHAAALNLGSSAVANTLPGGGAVAMGVSWAMLSSWGVGMAEYVRYTLVSGLWNVFAGLGLPVLALAALTAAGQGGLVPPGAAFAGAGALLAALAALLAVLRSESFTRRAAGALGRAAGAACRLVRRPPDGRLPGMLIDFRAGAAGLIRRRWLPITAATVASQLALWLVLLACLRASGLGQGEVAWQASLAAFAFARLLSVLPLTPGGVGIVEAGLTAPLVAGLGPGLAARVAAAVLVYRAVTYLLPLPLGAAAYLWWRRARRRQPRAAGRPTSAAR